MTTSNKQPEGIRLRDIIGPAFYEVHRKIKSGQIDETDEEGGRSSLKSSFISAEMVLQMIDHPNTHALAMRQVGDTLRDSVYSQIGWAIDKLGLTDQFTASVSPLQYTYKPTGQVIYFRGLDEPTKIKGIKPKFGHIAQLWFEEADQIKGGDFAIRNVLQSAQRGGDWGMVYLSFNPPASSRNWVLKYAAEKRAGKLHHKTTYLQAPPEWLGKKFLETAEYIKETKPEKYRHEYLGEHIGNGTQVFDNIVLREISPQEVRDFDRPLNGVDWGWYPDPWAFNRCHYDAARRTLYIFDELTRLKTPNHETARLVKQRIRSGEAVIADSAEHKSCGDYRDAGIRCRDAVKGPGSVRVSMEWLQGLNAIIIDPEKCPDTAKEFDEYEYETDKNGEVIPGYVDAKNHHIDAVRYATNDLWRRRGN